MKKKIESLKVLGILLISIPGAILIGLIIYGIVDTFTSGNFYAIVLLGVPLMYIGVTIGIPLFFLTITGGILDRALHQYDCYVAKLESPTMEELLYNNACTVKYANISYNYNYEDSENYGVYFIDDCDYGSKIEYIPANPTREGYIFDGWYKEPECINKWNYESDTLPEEIKEVNENNEEEVKFQETKLYAKWNH